VQRANGQTGEGLTWQGRRGAGGRGVQRLRQKAKTIPEKKSEFIDPPHRVLKIISFWLLLPYIILLPRASI